MEGYSFVLPGLTSKSSLKSEYGDVDRYNGLFLTLVIRFFHGVLSFIYICHLHTSLYILYICIYNGSFHISERICKVVLNNQISSIFRIQWYFLMSIFYNRSIVSEKYFMNWTKDQFIRGKINLIKMHL